MNHCMRHYEEPTVALCRTCQRPFCSRCLVFSFGPNKPPFCVGCALSASGVRNKGLKPVAPAAAVEVPDADRKAERAQRKAEKAAAKAGAKASKAAARNAPAAGPPPAVGPEPTAPRPSHVPGPSQLSLRTAHDAMAAGMHPRV